MKKFVLILLLLPALGGAQGSVRLEFADARSRVIWTAKSLTDAPPPSAATDARTVTVDHVEPDAYVCVRDETSGNLAAKVAKDRWTVVDKDFGLVAKLVVRVDQGGSPTAYASVSIGSQTKLIDPGSKGETTFYGVPFGDVRVAVNYKEGGLDRTQAQRFGLSKDRDTPSPTWVVALAGEGATGSTGSEAAQTPKPKAPVAAPPSGSLIGQLFLIVVVAGGAIAGLVFGLKWIYSNQDKAKDALAKVGVQVPDPADPDPDPAIPSMPQPSGPAPQILLGDSAPVAPFAQAMPALEPRLVGPAGTFELGEGVHVIGREAGLTISLVGESSVSRRHAEIVRTGDALVLRDLGSTNGTFVNGVKIAGDQTLRRGDSLQLGSVQFRLE